MAAAEPRVVRKAILAAPLEIAGFGEAPQSGTLYVPASHIKALRLHAHVVIGGRGVGKSMSRPRRTCSVRRVRLRHLR